MNEKKKKTTNQMIEFYFNFLTHLVVTSLCSICDGHCTSLKYKNKRILAIILTLNDYGIFWFNNNFGKFFHRHTHTHQHRYRHTNKNCASIKIWFNNVCLLSTSFVCPYWGVLFACNCMKWNKKKKTKTKIFYSNFGIQFLHKWLVDFSIQ